jgi:AcrR family transcriptional regulator
MTKTTIRKPGEKRREEIKESILDIIFNEGMHKLSTRYLATKVGVSEGTLFRHYPSKKAMIEDIINDVINEMIGSLKVISKKEKPPKERLDEYISFTLDYLYHKKGVTLLLFTEASYQNDEGLKNTLNNIYNSQKSHFKKIILDGINKGIWDETINVDNLAQLYMGVPVTLNVEMILNNKHFNIDLFREQMKKIIFKVLAKR